MNRVLHACGLESRPRWIEYDEEDVEPIGGYRWMCSNCGESIKDETPPVFCPHCKERMRVQW